LALKRSYVKLRRRQRRKEKERKREKRGGRSWIPSKNQLVKLAPPKIRRPTLNTSHLINTDLSNLGAETGQTF